MAVKATREAASKNLAKITEIATNDKFRAGIKKLVATHGIKDVLFDVDEEGRIKVYVDAPSFLRRAYNLVFRSQYKFPMEVYAYIAREAFEPDSNVRRKDYTEIKATQALRDNFPEIQWTTVRARGVIQETQRRLSEYRAIP